MDPTGPMDQPVPMALIPMGLVPMVPALLMEASPNYCKDLGQIAPAVIASAVAHNQFEKIESCFVDGFILTSP